MIRSARRLYFLFKASQFARNIALLAGGNLLAQLVGLASSPLLTRMYTPEEFGILGVFMSVSSLLITASTLRYEMALPLPKDERTAVNLLWLGHLLVLAMTALSAAICYCWGAQLAALAGTPELAPYLWLMPFSLACYGVYQLFNLWSTRLGRFGEVSGSRVSQGVVTALASLYFGWIGWAAEGLVAGMVAGYLAAALTNIILVVWRDRGRLVSGVSWRGIRATAREFRKFPQFNLPTSLMNATSRQLPLLLLAGMFNQAVAGHYNLAHRIFTLPMFLLANAWSQAFYKRAADAHNAGEDLRRLVLSNYRRLVQIGALPTLLLFFVAPPLCGMFFGAEWQPVGDYLRLLVPWLYIAFIVNSSTCIYAVLNRQDVIFYFDLAMLIARLASLVVGWYCLHSDLWAIGLYGFVGAVGNGYQCWRILVEVERDKQARAAQA